MQKYLVKIEPIETDAPYLGERKMKPLEAFVSSENAEITGLAETIYEKDYRLEKLATHLKSS